MTTAIGDVGTGTGGANGPRTTLRQAVKSIYDRDHDGCKGHRLGSMVKKGQNFVKVGIGEAFAGEGSIAMVAPGTKAKRRLKLKYRSGLPCLPSFDGVGVSTAEVGAGVESWVPISIVGAGVAATEVSDGVGSTVSTIIVGAGVTTASMGTRVGYTVTIEGVIGVGSTIPSTIVGTGVTEVIIGARVGSTDSTTIVGGGVAVASVGTGVGSTISNEMVGPGVRTSVLGAGVRSSGSTVIVGVGVVPVGDEGSVKGINVRYVPISGFTTRAKAFIGLVTT